MCGMPRIGEQWSEDGRRFTITFSGGSGANSWNTVEGSLALVGDPVATKPAPARQGKPG